MHVPFEGPGYVEDFLRERNETLTRWPLYEKDALPDPEEVDFLLVMGGPMSVHDTDKFPWLEAEKSFLRSCIETGVRVLGICLGAQLLADVMGTSVYPCSQKEIGWFPVDVDPALREDDIFRPLPGTFTAFHWHGETFDIPSKARNIGSSEACTNQGFLLARQVLALQFHLEVTPVLVEGLIKHGVRDLDDSPYVQKKRELLRGLPHRHRNRELLYGMLGSFLRDIQVNTPDNE